MTATFSRRHLVGAGSLAGLAAEAVTGVSYRANAVAPAQPLADHALLIACAEFEAAHAEQEATAHDCHAPDSVIEASEDRWYGAVQAILEAQAPETARGRIALASAARSAFVDQITGCGTFEFEKTASPEERLAAMALSAAVRA